MVGKTRLCKALASELQRIGQGRRMPEVRHHGPEIAGFEPDQLVQKAEPWLVCDRFHLSDIVYGKLFREGSPIDGPAGLPLSRRLREEFGAFVVLVLATEDVYQAALKNQLGHDGLFVREEKYDLKQNAAVAESFRLHASNWANSGRIDAIVALSRRADGSIVWPGSDDVRVRSLARAYLEKQTELEANAVVRWSAMRMDDDGHYFEALDELGRQREGATVDALIDQISASDVADVGETFIFRQYRAGALTGASVRWTKGEER